ncbi:hypothetical protein [Nocardioides litoris]|uniref:hypothetical protein n=1 Tax=Nocardioides litoris TaxID=1926648 RepID=UPI00111D96B9|nr:hypothetical protein [Nocardioides litoris]
MFRRILASSAAGLLLAAGLSAAPTPAPPASAAVDNSIGVITAPRQAWKPQCARYRLNWRFTPPAGNDGWTVIANIIEPRGFSIRSEFWDSNSPNKLGQTTGSLTFPMCGSSIKPGRYKIKMQMIVTDGRDEITLNRAPTYFKIFRKRR